MNEPPPESPRPLSPNYFYLTSALIPLNSCGAYMAATLGVATLSYAPFVFFNILNPLISILFGVAGIRMLKQ